MRIFLLLSLLAAGFISFAEEVKKELPAGFRTFTGKNGKTLEAMVEARLDDETYTLKTAEGKTLRMKVSSLSDSDQEFLVRWDPEFAVDLSTVKLEEAARKMGYTAVKMDPSPVGTVVHARIGDTPLKLYLDPKAKNSMIDKAAAQKAALKTRASNTVFQDAAGNKTQAEECSQTQLSFAGFIPEDLTILVVDLAAVGAGNIKNGADGILGGDLLERMNALLDFKGKQLYVK